MVQKRSVASLVPLLALQSPSASSRLGSEWITWRYFSTSSSGVSNFPDLSLSSKDLANLYGLAVMLLSSLPFPLSFFSCSRPSVLRSPVTAMSL